LARFWEQPAEVERRHVGINLGNSTLSALAYCTTMPLYFFYVDVDDGDDGVEYRDDASARQAAMQTFGAMIGEGSIKTEPHMSVADETRRHVLSLNFSADQ
jgi:hypothetical protein